MKNSDVVRELRARAEAYVASFAQAQHWEDAFQALEDRSGQEALDIMVEWTRAHVERVGAKGLVVGVSGGVDSALATYIMAKAVPDACLGLILPAHSQKSDQNDALALLELLQVPHEIMDLGPVVEATLLAMGEKRQDTDPMATGNLAARQRQAVIYHQAQKHRYLVLGTSDLDETWIGYGCKGSASDLSPMVGLHKEEVRALVKVALTPLDEDLAQCLAERPASPGYFAGQLAEEELGLPYARIGKCLDIILDTCEITAETGVTPRRTGLIRERLKAQALSGEDFLHVAALISKNLHKTLASPALWPDPIEEHHE